MKNKNRRSIGSPGSNLKDTLYTEVHKKVVFIVFQKINVQISDNVHAEVYWQMHNMGSQDSRSIIINIQNELNRSLALTLRNFNEKFKR